MAYTPVPTVATNDYWSAAQHNTYVRDNFAAGVPDIFTTKGDLAVATGADVAARLAVGGDGAPLVGDGAQTAGMRWANTNKTASSGSAVSVALYTQGTAAANGDDLYSLHISPTFHTSTYTGLTTVSLIIGAGSSDGTGVIDDAFSLHVSPPTIGTNNWPFYVTAGNVRLGDGIVFVNDTANAKMTKGLTINQGASDDEIIALKSSDVAHGMTSLTETDTFAMMKKTSGTIGGLNIQTFSTDTLAFNVFAHSTTDDTTKTVTSSGVVVIDARKKSGTSYGSLGANANAVVIKNATATTHIFDGEGDSHQDVGTAWTNFDDHDDASLLTALSVHVSRKDDPIRGAFQKFLRGHRKQLSDLRLVSFNRNGHHIVNMSRLTMLLVGAVRQQSDRLTRLEQRLLQAGV
jgi:hypothetical protein